MKNTWKIIIALALVLCMVTMFVACKDDTTADAPAGDTPAGDTTPPAEDPGNDTTGVDGTLNNNGDDTTPGFNNPV